MEFLFQQATPDTSPYMIAGYAVIFGVMLVYQVSLVVRARSLKQDLDLLEDLEQEGQRQVAREQSLDRR